MGRFFFVLAPEMELQSLTRCHGPDGLPRHYWRESAHAWAPRWLSGSSCGRANKPAKSVGTFWALSVPVDQQQSVETRRSRQKSPDMEKPRQINATSLFCRGINRSG